MVIFNSKSFPKAQGPKPNACFTLIELLVVVAIIAVLVSILLPAMGAARDRARQVVCQSNQKQIQVGMTMYAESFNGSLPTAGWCGNTPANYSQWSVYSALSLLYPKYLTDPKVFLCPGAEEEDKVTVTPWYDSSMHFTTSYIYQDSGGAVISSRPALKLWKEYTDRVWFEKFGIPILACKANMVEGVAFLKLNHGGKGIVFGKSNINFLFLENNGELILKNMIAQDDNPTDGLLGRDDSVYFCYWVTQWRGWNSSYTREWR